MLGRSTGKWQSHYKRVEVYERVAKPTSKGVYSSYKAVAGSQTDIAKVGVRDAKAPTDLRLM